LIRKPTQGKEKLERQDSYFTLKRMDRLKKSIEFGAKLIRNESQNKFATDNERIEVKYGYDVIDDKNYNEQVIEK
jgi:hypothetical protein